jgi:hypothetical protein
MLRASAARRAAPDILAFYFRQSEGGLADNFANAELSHPVPRANRVAQSALKTILEGFSARLLYLNHYLFKGRNCFHCLLFSSFLEGMNSFLAQKNFIDKK